MHQVFINYASPDQAFAAQLTDDIAAFGAQVWLDVRDARPGRHWARSIAQALNDSTMMIVILSPEALDSPAVNEAWQSYLEAYRPVLPVIAAPCNAPAPLRARRPEDFSDAERYTRTLHNLMTRLLEYSTREPHRVPIMYSGSTPER